MVVVVILARVVVVGVTESIVTGNCGAVVFRVIPLHIELPPMTPQPLLSAVNQLTGAVFVVVHVAVAYMVHDNNVAHRALMWWVVMVVVIAVEVQGGKEARKDIKRC